MQPRLASSCSSPPASAWVLTSQCEPPCPAVTDSHTMLRKFSKSYDQIFISLQASSRAESYLKCEPQNLILSDFSCKRNEFFKLFLGKGLSILTALHLWTLLCTRSSRAAQVAPQHLPNCPETQPKLCNSRDLPVKPRPPHQTGTHPAWQEMEWTPVPALWNDSRQGRRCS